MSIHRIPVLIDNKRQEAVFEYKISPPTIHISLASGLKTTYEGDDIYDCLGKIIKALPHINFLCKGAKINVRPSSMSSQMSCGVVAYEHLLGIPATRKNLVNIFDYEDTDIINDPQLQKDYFHRWLDSLAPPPPK